MREMKDSGIAWIGAMPRAWKMNTIAQIFLQVKCKNTGLQEKNLLSLSYADLFRREIEEDREKRKIQRENGIKSSIPRNMSREAIDRTSPSVSKILYQGYVNDVYSKLDIARHLNVGQNHIDKFLREVSKWNR